MMDWIGDPNGDGHDSGAFDLDSYTWTLSHELAEGIAVVNTPATRL